MKSAWNLLERLLREEEDDDFGELPGAALARQKGTMAQAQSQKSANRLDMLKQRNQATQGGTVQLRHQMMPKDLGHVVKGLVGSSPDGLTLPQIMKGIDAAMYPGEPYSEKRVKSFLTNKEKSGWSLMNFLRQAATNVGGKWKLK